VLHEHVTRSEEDDIQTIIDKEKHKDVYHTTVQPVQDRGVKATQEKYEQAAVQNREFDYDDQSKVQQRLGEEQAQFRNTISESEAQRTQVVEPTIVSEHATRLHARDRPAYHREGDNCTNYYPHDCPHPRYPSRGFRLCGDLCCSRHDRRRVQEGWWQHRGWVH
jgi:hypothetical protein